MKPTLQLFEPKNNRGAIALRNVETDETVQVIVLPVLRAYGFPMVEDALVDPRKLR